QRSPGTVPITNGSAARRKLICRLPAKGPLARRGAEGNPVLAPVVTRDNMAGTDTREATGMATRAAITRPGEESRGPQMLRMNGYRYGVAMAFALIATSTSHAQSVKYSFIVKNNICSFPQAGEEACNSTIMRLDRTNGEIIEFTANYRTGGGSPTLTSMHC